MQLDDGRRLHATVMRINGVPLPWTAADRLVAVSVARPQWRSNLALAAYWDRGNLSWPLFQELQEKRRTL